MYNLFKLIMFILKYNTNRVLRINSIQTGQHSYTYIHILIHKYIYI